VRGVVHFDFRALAALENGIRRFLEKNQPNHLKISEKQKSLPPFSVKQVL
jgi:hypothetical protein